MKAIMALLLVLCIGPAAEAKAGMTERLEKQCRFQKLDPGTWTEREERRTAACIVEKFGVIGGLPQLDSTIDCESGWWRFASNDGRYLGLAQHEASSWPGRVHTFMPDGWKIGPWERWTNSRSQLVTTVRMVNASGGWSAWACA